MDRSCQEKEDAHWAERSHIKVHLEQDCILRSLPQEHTHFPQAAGSHYLCALVLEPYLHHTDTQPRLGSQGLPHLEKHVSADQS